MEGYSDLLSIELINGEAYIRHKSGRYFCWKYRLEADAHKMVAILKGAWYKDTGREPCDLTHSFVGDRTQAYLAHTPADPNAYSSRKEERES